MSAPIFLDLTKYEKNYKHTKGHPHERYSREYIIRILAPHVEGRTEISRWILRTKLKQFFDADKVHSILTSAVKRGLLVPLKRTGCQTVLYSIRINHESSVHHPQGDRGRYSVKQLEANRDAILKLIGREDLMEGL